MNCLGLALRLLWFIWGLLKGFRVGLGWILMCIGLVTGLDGLRLIPPMRPKTNFSNCFLKNIGPLSTLLLLGSVRFFVTPKSPSVPSVQWILNVHHLYYQILTNFNGENIIFSLPNYIFHWCFIYYFLFNIFLSFE